MKSPMHSQIYLHSHCDTTTKSVGGIFVRRCILKVQLQAVCSEAIQRFQCCPLGIVQFLVKLIPVIAKYTLHQVISSSGNAT